MTNKDILILAPHTDDGELGCGGTIARFVEEGRTLYYAAFSTAADSVPPPFPPNVLEKEVKKATKVLGIPEQNLILFDYQVRKLEYRRQDVLEDLIKLKSQIDPGMVFLPCENDLHQDHITIYNEGLRAFKQCTVLGYELPWNNITFHTRHFVFLQERHVAKKFEALQCYRSQKDRHYVDKDFIYGLARTRGVQLGTEYAEAFDVIRWVLA